MIIQKYTIYHIQQSYKFKSEIKAMDSEQKLKEIENYGKSARGRRELTEILSGRHVSYKGRCLAMCYDCMGYYSDGKHSCENQLCPLYGVMPFKRVPEAEQNES